MCKGPLVTAELGQGVKPGKRVARSFPGRGHGGPADMDSEV